MKILLGKLKVFYNSKSSFLQRIIKLISLIFLLAITNCFYMIVSFTIICMTTIIFPAYFHLKKVNNSSEFESDIFKYI